MEITPIEHIRKRPAMYIGEPSIYGFHTILSYLFGDLEKIIKLKTEIKIKLKKENRIKIEIHDIETSVFVETINNLKKFNENFSLGLSVLVGLSEELKIKIDENQNTTILNSKKGIYTIESEQKIQSSTKIEFEFKLDTSIFLNLKINYEILNIFIRKYAFLNSDFKIISINKSSTNIQTNIFEYPNGINEILEIKIAEIALKAPKYYINLKTKIENYEYNICFCYQNNWLGRNFITSYANHDDLYFGGSLENGILDGIILAINNNAVEKGKKIEINYKNVKKELFLIANVKGLDFTFGGATKSKLEMPKMRKIVKEFVFTEMNLFLSENQEISNELLEKFKHYH